MRRRTALALAAVPTAFLAWFFAWPVASIAVTSLAHPPVPGSSIDLGVIWFTVWQAAVSTLLALAAGLPLAFVIARFDFPGRRLLRAVTLVPFVLPTLVVGVAFLALIGPSGMLGIDLTGTAGAVIAAHVFFNFAVVVRLVGGLWAQIDPRLEEAAASLGAGPWKAWLRVTFPLLRPAVIASAAIVFLFCLTSFGTVLVLGSPQLATIEVEIHRKVSTLFDLRGAALLALIQMAGVTLALLAYSRHQDRSRVQHSLTVADPRPVRTARGRLLVIAAAAWTLLLVGLPTGVLAWRAFTSGGRPTAAGLRALAESTVVDVGPAVAASLGYAAAATLIAVGVGLPAAVVIAAGTGRISRWFDTLLMLPLGTSAVTLGFGMLVALDAPIDLRASVAIIPIAHALVALPFVVRATVPVLGAIRDRLREAAAVLGADPRRVWREVDLPMARGAVAIGAGFAFVVSLGEFGATTFLARPGSPTIPLAIFRMLGRPGTANLQGAMVLSVILMAITVTAVLLVERIRMPGRDLF